MKRLLFLALLVAPLTFAQVPRTVSLTPPTERTDGTQLFIHEIARHEVDCFEVDGASVTNFEIVPPATSGLSDPVFAPGEYRCRARTVDTLGQESEWTQSQVFTVGSPCQEAPSTETCAAPAAPQSITVTLD